MTEATQTLIGEDVYDVIHNATISFSCTLPPGTVYEYPHNIPIDIAFVLPDGSKRRDIIVYPGLSGVYAFRGEDRYRLHRGDLFAKAEIPMRLMSGQYMEDMNCMQFRYELIPNTAEAPYLTMRVEQPLPLAGFSFSAICAPEDEYWSARVITLVESKEIPRESRFSIPIYGPGGHWLKTFYSVGELRSLTFEDGYYKCEYETYHPGNVIP